MLALRSAFPIFEVICSIFFENSTRTPETGIPLGVLSTTAFPLVSNITSVVPEEGRSVLGKISGFISFFLITITGVVGNSLVIYTIFTDFTLQVQNQLANMPVLNLAYTDLITTGVCSLLGTIVIFFDGNPFGDIVCGVWAYTNLLGLITTIGILAVISFDRFIAVGWSLHYPQIMTYNRMLGLCILVWVGTLLITVFWVLQGIEYDFWAGVCDVTWVRFGPDHPFQFYMALWNATYYVFVPSIVILVCNLLIMEWSKDKGHKATLKNDTDKDAGKANAKILKAMIIVIASFFGLTFPSALIKIFKVLGGEEGPIRYIPTFVTTITSLLQLAASICNPFIYGLFRKDFRDAYAKLWKKFKQQLNLKK